ncbi:hypothetical protein CB1_000266004 [Camelus ferus]|nr:hypothetical protein CB1_000266004 [Camelus ferus]
MSTVHHRQLNLKMWLEIQEKASYQVILGTETCNKYEIKNSLGQRIYFAVEESICFNRAFCSTLRSCTLKITDNSGREVITVNRPLRCNSCWCPCYLQELEIQAPPGTIVGYVAQKWDPFLPKFTIQNANKEDILKIVGPCATCGCFGDVDFEVKTINEKLTIGKISKYWSGFVNDVFTNADNFGIHVPADLDVTVKASMIGACFLFVRVELYRKTLCYQLPCIDNSLSHPTSTLCPGRMVYWCTPILTNILAAYVHAQMNAPYPGTHLPAGYPPEYPSAAYPVTIFHIFIFQDLQDLLGTLLPSLATLLPSLTTLLPRLTTLLHSLAIPSHQLAIQVVAQSAFLSNTSQCLISQIEVYAPPGVPIGYVNQTWDLCLPKFTVQNERREDVLKITGPCIVCSCCADVDFEIKSLDDKYVVGKISKQWTGLVRELFTDVDNFGIQFPLDLDVKMKAVMLGACFLILQILDMLLIGDLSSLLELGSRGHNKLGIVFNQKAKDEESVLFNYQLSPLECPTGISDSSI